VARSTLTSVALHLGEHRRQRALKRLVDRGDGLGGKAGFQDQPEPQADIGLLARIFGGEGERHAIEPDRGAA